MIGYITIEEDVRISDIINQIDNEYLIDELKKRGLGVIKRTSVNNTGLEKEKLHHHLCDLCDCGYHTPIDQVFEMIRTKL